MRKWLIFLSLILAAVFVRAAVTIGHFDIQYSRPGAFGTRYFICDDEADKPTSGLNVADRAYVLSNQKVYIATSTTGWLDLTPAAGQVFKYDGSVWAPGSGVGYTLDVQALTSSPTDGQTVYFGQLPKAPVTAAATSKVYIPRNGTIKRANIYCYSGTAGTNESWSIYIRKNNTADTLVETVAASASERIFNNEALSISVVAGDYIEIKGVQPTWATNPLTTIYGGYLYIEE